MNRLHLAAFIYCLISMQSICAQNALTRSAHGMQYHVGTQVNFSNGSNPLWLTANRYGLSSVDQNNGMLRVGISRDANNDSTYRWRIGYVADIAVAYNYTSTAVIHQLAADFDYRRMRITVGAKEQPMALKNAELSSGSQTLGINSRPIPQIWVGVPEYINITGSKHRWAAIRGFISYGMMTDGHFQRDYLGTGQRHSEKVLFHSKAGYLRLGNEEKFPLTFEGGLEMASQFGGTIYNIPLDNGTRLGTIHMGHTFKDFVKATFALGSDPTDGIYANATGNTVGSWLFRLNYKNRNWGASVYYDHFFDDHSQMFMEYGWLDGLIGVEVELPQNPFVSHLVYENIRTDYQSGPVYHDHTTVIPDQISGRDNYYNHGIYVGWEHWGQAIGNPLYISPLYNSKHDLSFTANRFRAHHIGISGAPCNGLRYRMLYSFERSWGTYDNPFVDSRTTHSFLAEATYAPTRLGRMNGWQFGAALGFDHGNLLGNNFGFQFSISKSGWIIK